MSGLEQAKVLAGALDLPVKDLFVLGRGNDPYSIGSPAHVRDAEWFMRLWDRFDFSRGVHLRRIHYRLVSHGDVTCPDGMPYVNTDKCDVKLGQASKYARILGLIDPALFVDRRNPDPKINAWHAITSPEVMVVRDPSLWSAPSIAPQVPYAHFWVHDPQVTGYATDDGDQPNLVEVWVEKSTMNDILVPLCRSLGVNLVTSIGFQSLTAAINLVQRAIDAGKPARVLYIADHDPAGDRMPIAVARQVQYRLDQLGIGIELTLEELALTPQQVQRYNLPRVPIKSHDSRRQGFEDLHGEGAVELDALEALHPGELDRIVRSAILRYRDSGLQARAAAVSKQARLIVQREWDVLAQPYRAELGVLEDEANRTYARYQKRLTELSSELRTELIPVNERLAELREQYRDAAAEFDPEIPDKPEAVADGPENPDPLFDTRRDPMEQLAAFRRHKP